jgi:hypothetical protein
MTFVVKIIKNKKILPILKFMESPTRVHFSNTKSLRGNMIHSKQVVRTILCKLNHYFNSNL